MCGTAVLRLDHSVKARAVLITLKGTESCTLLEWDNRVDPIVSVLNRGSKSCFTEVVYTVATIPSGRLEAGDHYYSFSLPTSPTLPGSFDFREKWKKVAITYSLHPSLKSAWGKFECNDTVVTIAPRSDYTLGPVVVGKQVALTSYPCICRGAVDINFRCDKVAYAVGETAEIEVEVRTDMCRGKIKKVGIGVIYSLTFQRSFGLEKELSRRWVSGKKLARERLCMSIPIREKDGKVYPFSAVGSKLRSEYTLKVVVLMESHLGAPPEKEIKLKILPQHEPLEEQLVTKAWAERREELLATEEEGIKFAE